MAQVMRLIDDITGEAIEDGQGQTVTFSVNGTSYEIDLADKQLKKFHEALGFYIDHGRQVGGMRRGPGRPAGSSTAPSSGVKRAKRDPEQLNAIRSWWRSQGNEISDRGRIPYSVEEAYNEAHK